MGQQGLEVGDVEKGVHETAIPEIQLRRPNQALAHVGLQRREAPEQVEVHKEVKIAANLAS
ncbi:hypothetical protein YIM73518_00090 [Thermus brockianus]|uniref:Transposase n=1 Tax=Thermus brockianus TaxID=56956 RepID=A0ABN6NEX9_THEBO|nr:hypothetical protein TbrSNM41_09320 [Thermus brockianus]